MPTLKTSEASSAPGAVAQRLRLANAAWWLAIGASKIILPAPVRFGATAVSHSVGQAVAWAELSLGVMFLARRSSRWAARIGTAGLVVVTIIAPFLSRQESCGCVGRLPLQRSAIMMLAASALILHVWYAKVAWMARRP